MKRFLQSVFPILRETNRPKSAAAPRRPSATPLLEVRTQVKAGGKGTITGGTSI
jgi:hypothetical protein